MVPVKWQLSLAIDHDRSIEIVLRNMTSARLKCGFLDYWIFSSRDRRKIVYATSLSELPQLAFSVKRDWSLV